MDTNEHEIGTLLNLRNDYLASERFTLILCDQAIEDVLDHIGRTDLTCIHGILEDFGTGEIWVTPWSQPWNFTACYERIR